MAANTRPYTREELKSLRRANLQNLFKIHNLKGANGTNTILIDTLVSYFASPTYLTIHPPPTSIHLLSEGDKEKSAPVNLSLSQSQSQSHARPGSAQGRDGKEINRYRGGPPSRPIRGRVVSSGAGGAGRRVKEIATVTAPTTTTAGLTSTSTSVATSSKVANKTDRKDVGARPPKASAHTASSAPAPGQEVDIAMTPEESHTHAQDQASISDAPGTATSSHTGLRTSNPPRTQPTLSQQPTPPVSTSTPSIPAGNTNQSQQTVTLPQVEALLQANDAQWQARLEALERNLNAQLERLRLEMAEIRDRASQVPSSAAIGSGNGPGPSTAPGSIVAGRSSVGQAQGQGRTWSPWEARSVSGPSASGPSNKITPQKQPNSQSTLPFPILGKRRHPHLESHLITPVTTASTGAEVSSLAAETGLDDLSEREQGEAKRVRFNGSRPGDLTPSFEVPPAFLAGPAAEPFPKTPSPQKSSATSTFGADYFSRPGLGPITPELGTGIGLGGGSIIPRTPSPSRQGIIPDNSQTPRLPADWHGDRDDDRDKLVDSDDEDIIVESDDDHKTGIKSKTRTPEGAVTAFGNLPEFATTPEPPHRPVSPITTMERSVSASSDRFTPGRMNMVLSTPSNPTPGTSTPMSNMVHSDDRRLAEGIPLSTVTDLERIDETDESSNPNLSGLARSHISPGGQLRFPIIKPTPRLSGLGMPGSASKLTPRSQMPGMGQGHQRTASATSLLAPPALISRNSRAGSELPNIRIRSRSTSRGLSPPPRPSSANAIHGASTPPRTMFPLNLPDLSSTFGANTTGVEHGNRIRSASADYMHVAMHGLEEDDLDFEDGSLLQSQTQGFARGQSQSGLLHVDDYPHTSEGATPRRRGMRSVSGPGLGSSVGMDLGSSAGLERRGRAGEAGTAAGSGSAGLDQTPIRRGRREMPTPSHRTLLGTERYNDKRFGDIPVGVGYGIGMTMGLGGGSGSAVWDSPRVDSASGAGTRNGLGTETPS